MGDWKRSCPACDAWTNSVGIAFRDGAPCPHCGLPADAALAVDAARGRAVADDIVKRYLKAEALTRSMGLELVRLRRQVERIRAALDNYVD